MVCFVFQFIVDLKCKVDVFVMLVVQGCEMEYEGYWDIYEDMMILLKVKKVFFEMYKECVQEFVFISFSCEYVLFFSYCWLIDGIGVVLYCLLVIWE